MLRYASAGISNLEIPGEKSLVIYISECQNHCSDCHSEYLHDKYGELLLDNFKKIFELYFEYFTVVCFMGEGRNTLEEHDEFKTYCDYCHSMGKKSGIYVGRDCDIEKWMNIFDYIKIGSYNKKLGELTKKFTNQRLFMFNDGEYTDITNRFWN